MKMRCISRTARGGEPARPLDGQPDSGPVLGEWPPCDDAAPFQRIADDAEVGKHGTVIPPTGKAFDLEFSQTVKWDGDQVIEILAFWDTALQAQQIGLA
jgi:hypothetical protein